jgi:hypothetical protein
MSEVPGAAAKKSLARNKNCFDAGRVSHSNLDVSFVKNLATWMGSIALDEYAANGVERV